MTRTQTKYKNSETGEVDGVVAVSTEMPGVTVVVVGNILLSDGSVADMLNALFVRV